MKKTHLGAGLLLLMVFLFGSCSTDVDLYADFKDITIVYGLLDINKDTNYVKINRAFLGYGDANEIAMIPDSSNYPGKLDAKIIEYRSSASGNNYEKTTRRDSVKRSGVEPHDADHCFDSSITGCGWFLSCTGAKVLCIKNPEIFK